MDQCNGVKKQAFLWSNPITAYSAYTLFTESPCLWLSSTFSAIFRHPLSLRSSGTGSEMGGGISSFLFTLGTSIKA